MNYETLLDDIFNFYRNELEKPYIDLDKLVLYISSKYNMNSDYVSNRLLENSKTLKLEKNHE